MSNNEAHLKTDNEVPHFEVDSIELAAPQLFSNDEEINSFNHENKNAEESQENTVEKEPEMFESSDFKENSEIKEPEMFENSDVEDDFEIPAFLRRQKN